MEGPAAADGSGEPRGFGSKHLPWAQTHAGRGAPGGGRGAATLQIGVEAGEVTRLPVEAERGTGPQPYRSKGSQPTRLRIDLGFHGREDNYAGFAAGASFEVGVRRRG